MFEDLRPRILIWLVDEAYNLIKQAQEELERIPEPNKLPEKIKVALQTHAKRVIDGRFFNTEQFKYPDVDNLHHWLKNRLEWMTTDASFYNMRYETGLSDKTTPEELEFAFKTYFQENIVEPSEHHVKEIKNIVDRLEKAGLANPGAEPEAPEDAAWGKWAFAEDRVDVPDEPNTKEEDKIFHALDMHVNANDLLSKSAAAEINKQITQGNYVELLKLDEDKHPLVYRGMSIDSRTLIKLLELDEPPTRGDVIEKNLIVKPLQDSASWTTDYDQAVTFAKKYANNDMYNIVLFAKVDQNSGKFVINPDKAYNMNTLRAYSREKETIGVGPIKVFKVEVLNALDKYKKK